MRRTLALLLLAIAGVAAAQQADQELFREAENRFLAGEYELALDRYRTLVGDYPLSQFVPDAQFRIAVSLFQTGRADESLAQLERVSRRFRSTRYLGLVPFWRGVVQYELGLFTDAAASLQQFLASEDVPSELQTDAEIYLARSRAALGDQAGAITTLESVFSSGVSARERSFAFVLLLSLYVRTGAADEVLARVDAVDVSQLPPQWRDHVALYSAEALYQLGEIERAVPGFRQASGAAPGLATLAWQRLFALSERGLLAEEPREVVQQAEQALAGNTAVLAGFWLRVGIDSYQNQRPELAEFYFRRVWDLRESQRIAPEAVLYYARLLDERARSRQAISVLDEYFQRYGEREPLRSRLLLLLGNLLLRSGSADRAVTPLELAYARSRPDGESPDSDLAAEAAYQYAYALREAGSTTEALSVLDAARAVGIGGAGDPSLLRLRGRLLRETGRENLALEVLADYLELRPEDGQAVLERANLLFRAGQFADLEAETARRLASEGSDRFNRPVEAQIRYVRGLALVNLRRYAEAAAEFSAVTAAEADQQLSDVLPWAWYYQGWSFYRNGDYSLAVPAFSSLLERYPEHEQAARAAYLAGWSEFQQGSFERARQFLATAERRSENDTLLDESRFLRARALAADGSYAAASAEFLALYQDASSELADDALFEYAEAELAQGIENAAVEALTGLVEEFPGSALAEVAAFRRAEVLFAAQRYGPARDAYRAYRAAFPDGPQHDAALYWAGEASRREGETAGTLLLWERLISEYPGSPYHADAIAGAAELYRERGNYRQALSLYSTLEASYPQRAETIGAQQIIDQLALQIDGLDEREAELFVSISSNGIDSSAGRQSALELGRLVLLGRRSDSATVNRVLELLEQVGSSQSDPLRAGQAQFLIGEYRREREEFARAADRYLAAATAGASDSELAALAIYRAAESYAILGRDAEVRTLIAQLEQRFPDSPWLSEAQLLTGGDR